MSLSSWDTGPGCDSRVLLFAGSLSHFHISPGLWGQDGEVTGGAVCVFSQDKEELKSTQAGSTWGDRGSRGREPGLPKRKRGPLLLGVYSPKVFLTLVALGLLWNCPQPACLCSRILVVVTGTCRGPTPCRGYASVQSEPFWGSQTG